MGGSLDVAAEEQLVGIEDDAFACRIFAVLPEMAFELLRPDFLYDLLSGRRQEFDESALAVELQTIEGRQLLLMGGNVFCHCVRLGIFPSVFQAAETEQALRDVKDSAGMSFTRTPRFWASTTRSVEAK